MGGDAATRPGGTGPTAGPPSAARGTVLVLGGTGWLGRLVAEEARDRGRVVTVLARGRTGAPPPGVEVLTVDRDEAGAVAAATEGRSWDAVVELGSDPRHAEEAAAALRGRVRHVVVVSSVSVYADVATPGADESAPTVATGGDDYASAKVAVERAWHPAHGPGAVLAVRAGLLAGPGDESGRSGWWPWRATRPEPLLVPTEDAPTQLLDARDLAAFLVQAGEARLTGVLDAVGPVTGLHAVVDAARRAASGTTRQGPSEVLSVPTETLLRAGVQPWAGPASLPLWVPGADHAGFASRSGAAARASGLVARSLDETFRDVLAWELDRGDQPRAAGLGADDERRVRAAVTGA